MTTETDTIRTRPDGSIDTAYYMAIGRERRAEQAEILARKLFTRKSKKRGFAWPKFFAPKHGVATR